VAEAKAKGYRSRAAFKLIELDDKFHFLKGGARVLDLGAAPGGSFFIAGGLILNQSLTVIGGSERPGATQTTPPAQPGQPPTQTVVNTGQRNVAAVYALDQNRLLRLTTPVRQNITTATRDDERTTLEIVNLQTGEETLAGVAPENPVFNVFGSQRINVPPQTMVVDSKGTTYAITLSGLSVIPLAQQTPNNRPQIATGARGIVNSSDGTPNIAPGSFITITGTNLASSGRAETVPPPSVLGGSCVTFDDVSLPLLQTSANQILAQVPDNIRAGTSIVEVRSLAMAQSSDPVIVNVQKPANAADPAPADPGTPADPRQDGTSTGGQP